MKTNSNIDEKVAYGTPFRVLYLNLKRGTIFKKENWEGCIFNTIFHEIQYMICIKEEVNNGQDIYLKKPNWKINFLKESWANNKILGWWRKRLPDSLQHRRFDLTNYKSSYSR